MALNNVFWQWSIPSMGQYVGPGAVEWLVGDVDGDGQDEVVQLWANGSSLGMYVYGWSTSGMSMQWSATNMGQDVGPGALEWLVGDVDGDGQDEVIQLLTSGPYLVIRVFGWNGSAMAVQSTNKMTQGSASLAWLIGDVNGDGQDEVVQPWFNSGDLGMYAYGWSGGAMKGVSANNIVGKAPNATGWLIGDVDGDGRDEVVAAWASGSSLGINLYGWGATTVSLGFQSSTPNLSQTTSALQWLAGDVDGDGVVEVIQPFANGSSLGMNVYGWSSNGMATQSSSSSMGQYVGPGAVAWLVGDVDGDGEDEVVQLWANGSSLGMYVYGWINNAMSVQWSSSSLGQGSGAAAWLVGDVTGGGADDIVQPWANGSSLGMIVYGQPEA